MCYSSRTKGNLNKGGCSSNEKSLLTALSFSLHGEISNLGNDVDVGDDVNKGVNKNDGVDIRESSRRVRKMTMLMYELG